MLSNLHTMDRFWWVFLILAVVGLCILEGVMGETVDRQAAKLNPKNASESPGESLSAHLGWPPSFSFAGFTFTRRDELAPSMTASSKRQRLWTFWIGVTAVVVVCLTITFFTTRSLAYLRRAEERPHELWLAALKGLDGPVYYMGSEGDFSYFRSGKFFLSRYKARTAEVRLPQTFDFEKGTPYSVRQEMVRPY